jgi:hypothetical protein
MIIEVFLVKALSTPDKLLSVFYGHLSNVLFNRVLRLSDSDIGWLFHNPSIWLDIKQRHQDSNCQVAVEQYNGEDKAELTFHRREGLVVHGHNNTRKQAEVYDDF